MASWKQQAQADLTILINELREDRFENFAQLDERVYGAVCAWRQRYEALLADSAASLDRDPVVLWIDGEPITDSQLTQAVAAVMDEPIDVDAVLEQIGRCSEPIEFTITAARALIAIAQIQLALRHPENNGHGAQVAYEIAQNLGQAISSIVPDAKPLIEAGWQRHRDMSREEFKRLRQGKTLVTESNPTETKVIEAAVLLQQLAEINNQPILLTANKRMSITEGLTAKNPEAIDLEEISGITVAINCNAIEAQILINGINCLLAALPTLNPFSADPGEQSDP